MPENETLTSEGRWRPLRERLDCGDELIGLFPEIQDEFYRCLRAVFKQWRGCGVEPAGLFAAAVGDRKALHHLVQEARRHDYARLLVDVVAARRGADLGGIIRGWLDAAWESARAQIQVDRHESSRRGEFADRVGRMLGRLSRLLVDDPSRIPRRPPRDKSLVVDHLDHVLGLNLHVPEASPR